MLPLIASSESDAVGVSVAADSVASTLLLFRLRGPQSLMNLQSHLDRDASYELQCATACLRHVFGMESDDNPFIRHDEQVFVSSYGT